MFRVFTTVSSTIMVNLAKPRFPSEVLIICYIIDPSSESMVELREGYLTLGWEKRGPKS